MEEEQLLSPLFLQLTQAASLTNGKWGEAAEREKVCRNADTEAGVRERLYGIAVCQGMIKFLSALRRACMQPGCYYK